MTAEEQTAVDQRTPLYDLHLASGAKLVSFAGYAMPIQFPQGILKEHLHTRAQAGLFDVSHMGQVILSGPQAAADLERLVPVDLEALPSNHGVYGLLMNAAGGIRDDLIITRWDNERFFVVVNAACKAQDLAHLEANISADTRIETLDDQALLALQGPAAAGVLSALAPAVNNLVFMTTVHTELLGQPVHISRSGYTGEDGFEISVAASHATAVAEALLANDAVQPIGLGARDTLRLEAGLCLYGNDLDMETSPAEAALMWSVSKSRRPGSAKEGAFEGADALFEMVAAGPARKRVGLRVEGRAPVRAGSILQDEQGQQVGEVTSGGYG
ncbi:MAG: glycine cleavage system aminomethyltransferase GcvT, partial [Pseudomonadota bacterium]